jgi:superfamily II DNA/RNA helicase
MINEFRKKYNLNQEVVKGLDALGYKSPMAVQDRVIPHILNGKDLIVKSQTGSGKTGGFGIPIIEKIVIEKNLPQVLVLTPTRELAVQVCEEMAAIGRYKKVRCLPVYGKQPIYIQLRQLKQRVHVVVGTPGRVRDLIRKKHLRVDELKYLVIDEADELLKRGFIEEVQEIIRKTSSDRSTLLFSATMPQEIEEICSKYMVEPLRIEIEQEKQPIDQIKQVWYEVADDWKFANLKNIINRDQPDSCIIFCNTKKKADDLLAKLKKGGYSCTVLHGGLPQRDRLRAINLFKNKEVTYLIATDLAARGIHIDALDLVINYNVPVDCENYVHRIGRTGRAGEIGQAITFVSVHEKKQWNLVQDYIGYKVPLKNMNLDDNSTNKINNREKKKLTRGKKEAQHKDITRIRINAGKKKKIRPGDIVGAVCNIKGITSDDIGIIDIQDTCSYIEIFNKKGNVVMNELSKSKVKGKDVKVKQIKKPRL